MEKIHNVQQILIHRYAKLKNESVDKATARLSSMMIDDIMEKHRNTITLSIILIIIVTVTLFLQGVSLYRTAGQPYGLLLNALFLILCTKGLYNNREITQILKLLKAVGLK